MIESTSMKLVLALALNVVPLAGQQSPATMPKLGTVDPRFQSYNVEMVEVIGGRFWKPYGPNAPTRPSANAAPGAIDPALFELRTPIDLSSPRLRKLAAALGPVYLRVSGSWANTVYFQDSAAKTPDTVPAGFTGVLTRNRWKDVVDFAQALDARIVTSFSTGAGTRDSSGLWTPAEAKKFIDYTHSLGASIAAAEFMNEPTFPIAAGVSKDYDAAAYGRDFAVFQPFFRKAAPEALLLGPGSVGEGIDLVPMKLLPSRDLLATLGPNPVDVFSYHFYGGASERCGGTTSPDAALSEDWLNRTGAVETFYAKLRDRFAPGKPMWLTETGQTACGGDRWASTYLDTFRYLNQMGSLARRHVQVIMHNTLAASDYGLIDEKTLTPRPNYWAALLWHRTMGQVVLSPDPPPAPFTQVFAHCMANRPGGVTVLAINLSRSDTEKLRIPQPGARFMLTADNLTGPSVRLNGEELKLSAAGNLPPLAPIATTKGELPLPPASIVFLTYPDANNPACLLHP